MIRTEGLTKRYPLGDKVVTALHDVSLTVATGSYAAIIGPSGSGKSTLMHILGCLDNPSTGTYFLNGRDVSTLNSRELSQIRGEMIGFVFQGFQLLPRLTAQENVALPLLLSGVPRRKRMDRAAELLTQVGLGQRMLHRPSQLSGGQQQRVAIARALARDPALLLADEPTGNLDSDASRDVMALLAALHREGRTVLLITHDPTVAACAPRQIRIGGGKVISDDSSVCF